MMVFTMVVPVDTGAKPPFARSLARGSSAPIVFGGRAGYDFKIDKWSAGAQVRLPFGPGGLIELVPSGDVFFLDGEMDWQLNLDVALRRIRSGFRSPIYLGGGLAVLRRDFDGLGNEETKIGANLMAGIKLPVRRWLARPFVETRWTFIADDRFFRLVFGVEIPLGGS